MADSRKKKNFLAENEDLKDAYYEFDPEYYMCKCHGYFTGPLCEIPYLNCGKNQRCFNGGTCLYDDDAPSVAPNTPIGCSCPESFDGEFCQNKAVKEDALTKEGRISVSFIVVSFLLFGTFLYTVRKRSKDRLPKYVIFETDPSRRLGPRIILPGIFREPPKTPLTAGDDNCSWTICHEADPSLKEDNLIS
jgi:hypothetical protein